MRLPSNKSRITDRKSPVNKRPFRGLKLETWSFPAGFTLIELLVVIGIIGILASISIAAVNPLGQIAKAHDAQRKSDLGQIQKALQLYYQDNDAFPTGSNGQISNAAWATNWTVNGQVYMNVIPNDPNVNYTYFYLPASDAQSYRLFAHLEATNDSQMCANLPGTSTPACEGATTGTVYCKVGASSDPLSCNYEATSPNAGTAAQPAPAVQPPRR